MEAFAITARDTPPALQDLPAPEPRLPDGVDAHQAAVIGLAGIAAYDALETLDVQPGETVLISGATGGVGSIALQLAAAAGATVIATARPGQEEEYVHGLGATHTIDYTGDLPTAVRAIAPQGADKALHAAGDAASIGQVMRAGGTVASTLGATPEQLGRDDVRVAGIMAAATADKLARLLELVASGKLHVNIEARVPSRSACRSQRLSRTGRCSTRTWPGSSHARSRAAPGRHRSRRPRAGRGSSPSPDRHRMPARR